MFKIQLRCIKTMVLSAIATARRDRLLIAIFILVVLAASLSAFIGGTAVIEKREMMTAYIAVSTRLILVAGLVLFSCFHINRALDSREVDIIMSRPISRTNFIFGYVLSLVLVAAIAVVIGSLIVFGVARPEATALGLWAFSLFLECTVMVTAALFFVLVLRSAVAGMLACLGFYVLARMIGLLTGIAVTTGGDQGWWIILSARAMELLAVMMPRLDLFTQTRWLVYGIGDEVGWFSILAQGTVYVSLLTAAAVFDFRRRQF
jgi:ABC-type transport system involved in multi-copper enzyme maturation permease subunit